MKSILVKLVEEDFGYVDNSTRWGRAIQHDSLIVDKEKDRYHWNSEDLHGTPYNYLRDVRHLSHHDAVALLKTFEEYVDTFIHEIKGSQETVVYPELVNTFHENIWKDSRNYFHKRTITDETIARWKLGKYQDFYTIPIYSDGVLKNIQLRRETPVKEIRQYYKNPPVIFNGDILTYTNYIFLVEGTTSCIVMNQNHLPAVAPSSGANAFMESFLPRFINQKKVMVLYDNDSAGMKGAIQVAKLLGEFKVKIYNFWDFEEHYDVNDFFINGGTREELRELVRAKAKYCFQLK